MNLEHPDIVRHQSRRKEASEKVVLDAEYLRRLCLKAGADDVGFVEIDRPDLDSERGYVTQFFPGTKTLVSIVLRMNREPIRNPARSVANLEFHHTGDEVNDVARDIVSALESEGIRAINPPMGFPMETTRWPGRMWVVSHKPVAVAAGMGKMGIHRNVIHPKFGNFILLGTILLDAEASEYGRPLNYNPCLSCKLCVAACPVGAIKPDGAFDFSSCYTHNYREFMGGFADWVETIAESRGRLDYRSRVKPSETVSMWQSLGMGPNYKAAYCLAVCPAGEDVIAPFLDDKKGFMDEIVRPLQQKEEPIYVIPGSDAAEYVKRYPHKTPRPVRGSLIPATIEGFLLGLPLTFQSGRSAGIEATYHFTFTGSEKRQATIVIRDRRISVCEGHVGEANLRVTADSKTWLGFLAKEKSLVWALIRRKIRLRGSPLHLVAFGRCFPS